MPKQEQQPRRPGRPAAGDGKRVSVGVSLKPELYAAAKAEAEVRGESLARVIERAVETWIEMGKKYQSKLVDR